MVILKSRFKRHATGLADKIRELDSARQQHDV